MSKTGERLSAQEELLLFVLKVHLADDTSFVMEDWYSGVFSQHVISIFTKINDPTVSSNTEVKEMQ